MKLYLIGFAALALAACQTTGAPSIPNIPAPVELADRTAVDEEAAIAAESAYKLFRTAVELGVDTGVIKGERATRIAAADRTAYNALLVMRGAYKTANREDWINALRSANIALQQALATVRSK